MCRVTMGHLRVTIGHPRVTIGHLRLTIGHLRVTIGYFFYSKHKANTTELHPKVRQTCLKPKLVITVITGFNQPICYQRTTTKIKIGAIRWTI